jgi:hypothetical protein
MGKRLLGKPVFYAVLTKFSNKTLLSNGAATPTGRVINNSLHMKKTYFFVIALLALLFTSCEKSHNDISIEDRIQDTIYLNDPGHARACTRYITFEDVYDGYVYEVEYYDGGSWNHLATLWSSIAVLYLPFGSDYCSGTQYLQFRVTCSATTGCHEIKTKMWNVTCGSRGNTSTGYYYWSMGGTNDQSVEFRAKDDWSAPYFANGDCSGVNGNKCP